MFTKSFVRKTWVPCQGVGIIEELRMFTCNLSHFGPVCWGGGLPNSVSRHLAAGLL